jgi:hypothetical protein
MLDLFQYLVSPARVAEVTSTAIGSQAEHVLPTDNVAATIKYDDGSVATLLYTALGAKDLPKEYVEIYADGKVLVIDDYEALRVHGASVSGWNARVQDKGHLKELVAFAGYVRGKEKPPITLTSLSKTTQVSFLIAKEC